MICCTYLVHNSLSDLIVIPLFIRLNFIQIEAILVVFILVHQGTPVMCLNIIAVIAGLRFIL